MSSLFRWRKHHLASGLCQQLRRLVLLSPSPLGCSFLAASWRHRSRLASMKNFITESHLTSDASQQRRRLAVRRRLCVEALLRLRQMKQQCLTAMFGTVPDGGRRAACLSGAQRRQLNACCEHRTLQHVRARGGARNKGTACDADGSADASLPAPGTVSPACRSSQG